MLKWFRLRAPRIAAVALLSIIAMGASFGTSHAADCHDVACSPGLVAHDASAHAFRSAQPGGGSHPLHCLVCHWVRSFRPHAEIRFVSVPASDAGVRIHVESLTVAPSATVAQPALRSPPALPVL